MEINLLRKDDPLESGAIYQHITVQARTTKAKASGISETEAYPSPVSLPDNFQHIVPEYFPAKCRLRDVIFTFFSVVC